MLWLIYKKGCGIILLKIQDVDRIEFCMGGIRVIWEEKYLFPINTKTQM